MSAVTLVILVTLVKMLRGHEHQGCNACNKCNSGFFYEKTFIMNAVTLVTRVTLV